MAFPTTGIIDAFTTAQNPLATSTSGYVWGGNTLPVSGRKMRSLSGQCANDGSGGNQCNQGLNNLFSAGKHEVYCTYVTESNSRPLQLFAKINELGGTTTVDGYLFQVFQTTTSYVRIYRIDDGVATAIGSTMTVSTLTSGDVFGVECNNDAAGTITFFQNGATIGSVTDATYKDQAGYIGIGHRSDTARMDDFGGGLVAAASVTAGPVDIERHYPRGGSRGVMRGVA